MLLPGGQLPLQIFEPRYLNMVDDAMSGARLIGMIQTREGGERTAPRLARVGCVGRITAYAETGDGRYLITLTGVCRFAVGEELPTITPYRQVRAEYDSFAADLDPDETEIQFDRAPLVAALRQYLSHKGLAVEWPAVDAAPLGALVNSLAMGLPLDPAEKQALLEARPWTSAGGCWSPCSPSTPPRTTMTGRRRCSRSRGMSDAPASPELDPRLLEILVCPVTRGPLDYDRARGELVSRGARLAYPIREGVPIMLPEEARTLDESE
jgi:Lon protease-like protein/uncharacterized protein YbaR (Trm112 family)